ncbi:hypothetical protein J4E86_010543 [Alternaria arbusti]|uniref:uncharacterized protein n=1 Tax=Alternaria arbusti TaxID=232088 RepID=UPI0022205136|nr:uncharacterized protein J4E86_010543 [Alternaria arbusti]KAI4941043.1 hypothetical protein J4E86_010543 [Alternaria arbusti]
MSAPPTGQTTEMQDEDEWTDVSDDIAGLGLDGHGKPDGESNKPLSEEELALLPNSRSFNFTNISPVTASPDARHSRWLADRAVPILFSNDLPPCSLLPQLAYENTVHRLRKLWLERAHQESADIPLPSLCRLVLDDLKAEEEELPAGSQAGTKNRTPWRRETVFQYELRWVKYFVREAETAEKRVTMTEKQLDKQDFMDKMYPIPKELKIYVNNKKNQKMVSDSWKVWHHKKRGTVEQESAGLGVGGSKEEDGETAGEGGEDGEDGQRQFVDPTA